MSISSLLPSCHFYALSSLSSLCGWLSSYPFDSPLHFSLSPPLNTRRACRLLWAFDIVPVAGPDGKPIIPSKDDFTSGLITRPTPFPCAFRSRGNGVDELVVLEAERAEAEAARWDND